MKILETIPGARSWVNEGCTVVTIERRPGIPRDEMPETTRTISDGEWIATALEEDEESGELHECWRKFR